MIIKTFDKFVSLENETKNMVFLFWIYDFSNIITQIFISVFVFIKTQNLISVIVYYLLLFIGCVIGFSIWGFLISKLQLSIRLNYLKSFIILFLAFVFLFFSNQSVISILIFAFIYGIGLGMFWLGVHTFEMLHTHDKNRDFYSSMISIGGSILKIISPLVAIFCFFLSEEVFHVDTYYILLGFLPFIYLLAIPFLFKMPDYIPSKITLKEINFILFNPSLSKIRNYYFIPSFTWPLSLSIIPVISLRALGNVINIGLFEAIIGVCSIIIVLILSHSRHEGNRIRIMLYAFFIMLIAYIFLFNFEKGYYFFIIYSLIMIIAGPIYRVSQHVIDLKSVEIIKENNISFFSGLIIRDFILFLGRITGIGIILFVHYFVKNDVITIKIAIIIICLAFFYNWYSAKKLT